MPEPSAHAVSDRRESDETVISPTSSMPGVDSTASQQQAIASAPTEETIPVAQRAEETKPPSRRPRQMQKHAGVPFLGVLLLKK